jgi:hypothetical protein
VVEAAVKKVKKQKKRLMSDASGFPLRDKVEVRNPLLPKGTDEENNYELIDKDQIEGLNHFILKEKIEVIELAPKVFRYLRHLDGYDEANLRESLNPRNNIESIFKAGESQGKSGSFFFFS